MSTARSLARSQARRAFLWKRSVLQCGSPLTSTFINDVEPSSTTTLLFGSSLSPARCPLPLSLLSRGRPLDHPPKIVVRLILSSRPTPCPRPVFAVLLFKGISFCFSSSLPPPSSSSSSTPASFLALGKHHCRHRQMSILAHSRPS